MNQPLSALVVNEDPNIVQQLRAVLEGQQVNTRCARTCREAKAALSTGKGPDIIFAGTMFPDGTWRDVLSVARQLSPRTGVVVTTRVADMRLYLDVMGEGAADYIVPPFEASDVAHVVRSTVQSVAHGLFAERAAGAA